jgi:hypothetical protein
MSIADKARKIPGIAAAEGAVTGAIATEQDLPIADYDKQTAHDIAPKLKDFSQRELRMIGAYEIKHENRATITDKIATLTGEEPWSGYDEQSVDAITAALTDADNGTARKVLAYERDHKDRAGVLDAAHRHAGR